MIQKKDKNSLNLNTAVLFLVYKRPATTRRVFEAIRNAKPPRLYVASDGPKPDISGENDKIHQVREIITNGIDWDCDVKTLFQNTNLGCRNGVSRGIDWFFESENEGIILEDDCFPHRDFFYYCEKYLNLYRTNYKIWHINGNNFNCSKVLFKNKDYDFSSLPQVWGWATWKDRWKNVKMNPLELMNESIAKYKHWKLTLIGRYNKYHDIKRLIAGLDTWDFQWHVTILNANGLCICPRSNLISNIGGGEDATHTKYDLRINLPIRSFRDNGKILEVKLNRKLTKFYERKMGLYDLNVAFGNIRNDLKSFLGHPQS